MRIGQENLPEKDLTKDMIKDKLASYGKTFNASNKKIAELQAALKSEIDRNKILIGAIKGLQDLIKGEEIDPSEKDRPVDVPDTDSTEPCSCEQPPEGSEDTSGDDERQEPETEVEPQQ